MDGLLPATGIGRAVRVVADRATVSEFVVAISHAAHEIVNGLSVRVVGRGAGSRIGLEGKAQTAYLIVLEMGAAAQAVLGPGATVFEIEGGRLGAAIGIGGEHRIATVVVTGAGGACEGVVGRLVIREGSPKEVLIRLAEGGVAGLAHFAIRHDRGHEAVRST